MLEDGTPLAMSELARVLCDSQIGRVVLSAESIPLDLGRTQRLYTGAQRRAVIVRDRACTWNGCDVPAAYCEVHHIRWWDRDLGPTSVENGILLCSHHHHTVHRLDLDIVRHTGVGPGGAGPGEPVRYTFADRRGTVINAPPLQESSAALPGADLPTGWAPPGRTTTELVPDGAKTGLPRDRSTTGLAPDRTTTGLAPDRSTTGLASSSMASTVPRDRTVVDDQLQLELAG